MSGCFDSKGRPKTHSAWHVPILRRLALAAPWSAAQAGCSWFRMTTFRGPAPLAGPAQMFSGSPVSPTPQIKALAIALFD